MLADCVVFVTKISVMKLRVGDSISFIAECIYCSQHGLKAEQYSGSLAPCGVHIKTQLASFIRADLQGWEGGVSVRNGRRADTRSRSPRANRKSDFASDILPEWFLSVNSWMV